jgi:hypothetical protein
VFHGIRDAYEAASVGAVLAGYDIGHRLHAGPWQGGRPADMGADDNGKETS